MRPASATLEFLGSGTSTGVPIPACACPVCRSADPHDKRLRASALIRRGGRNIVIDTGPEFRIQCLRAGLMRLDAVLYTHDHADHLNGLDDVRAYSIFKDRTLPVWGSAETLASIRGRFGYIWNATQIGGGLPDIELRRIDGPFTAAGFAVTPIPLKHGRKDILGFRVGDLAYMTDISALPDSSLPLLENLGTMVLSCVRHGYHRTHLNIAGVKRLHRLVKPGQTLLTHLSHFLTHKELIAALPTDIGPAHDGMTVGIRL